MRCRWLTLVLLGAGACGGNDSSEPGPTEPADENRAPTVVGEIPAVTATEGETTAVDVSSYFGDPDGDALAYAATTSNVGVAGASVSGDTVTIGAVAAGTATVTVTASDPDGLTATQTIGVTVERPNRAPVPVGEIPAVTATEGETAVVAVSSYFGDPDGDALAYAATTSNVGVAEASVSGDTVTIGAVAAGSATVTVTASDPDRLTATQTIGVSILPPPAPDLVVESVRVSASSVTAGHRFELSATVRNRGDGDARSTTLRYYRSADAKITTADTEVGTDIVSGLDTLETSAESIRLTAPDEPGTYHYGACVDPISGESDTGNNCSGPVQVTVGAAPSPDLVVESPAVSDGSPDAGTRFELSATVRNRGDGDAPSTRLRYYRSADAAITTADTEVGTDFVTGLDASETSAESIRLTAPDQPGTYFYGACVDPVSGESDAGNNCSEPVRIVIIVSSLDPPVSARHRRDGSTIVVSWNRSPAATYYNVYYYSARARCSLRSGRPSPCRELATNVTDTTYVHTDPYDYFDNYYWIAACDGDGCSGVRWAGLPLRPSVRVVERSDNSLTVALESQNDDDFRQQLNYFELYRSTSEDGADAPVTTRVAALDREVTHVDRGLNSDAAYYYRTKACNATGCSEFSETDAGTTEIVGPVEIPPVPTGLGGEEVEIRFAPNDARIWWDAMPRATYYEVYQEGELDATVNAPYTRYYDTDPNEAFGFYATAYSVRACNKAGCSDLSPEFVVR